MQALRIHDWGQAPVVEDVAEPTRQEGEVLVQVQAAALAHLDRTVASGSFGMRPQLPYTGGVEGSGVVLEADDIPSGAQVMLRGGGLGLMRDGTWQERVSVSRKAVSLLNQELPPAVAATFFVPTTTAAVALHDVAALGAGERVAVVGAAGAVGASVVQQALLAGAEVVGLVSQAEQLADVPKGAEAVRLDDERVASWETERPFSLLVDTLGGDGLSRRSTWVRAGGRAVVIGYVAGASTSLDLPNWLLSDVALLPVNMIRQERRARELMPDMVERLASGELEVRVETVSLADAADALDRMARGRIRGRAVVLF
ncbi:zinc-binding dehydrogenase [Blastococcus sp. BMG 814]|uniref:Zinc-binding dehydrogenase n=1 Tax=Blastococcus carthaginiensis TaxID=3050034 RepID=A0ABT9IAD2_9ACTN|nr:zinc-binding dehydrogenase [Blastococcus carthaginiensis]MDP5182519.1 zinc-binding dehydrogenase [Blastococcus carthaginiensis]